MLPSVLFIVIVVVLFAGSISLDGGLEQKDLQGYRGLLALLIITDHLSQEMTSPGIMWIFSWVGYIIVGAFFAMSGYGLAVQNKKKANYLDSFLKKRIPKLLIPFWLSNCVYLLVRLFLYKESRGLGTILAEIFGVKLINSNAWYVVSLLVLYMLYYISVKFIAKNEVKKAIPYIIVGIIVYSVICLLVIEKYWWMNSLGSFVIGICIHEWPEMLKKLKKTSYFFSGTIIFVILFIGGWKFDNMAFRLLCMIPAAVLSSVLFFVVADRISLNGYCVRLLGEWSYELYLAHNCFRHLYKDILVLNNDIIYFMAVLGSSLVIAGALHQLSKVILSPQKRCTKASK